MKILSICWGKSLSRCLVASPSWGCGCLMGSYQDNVLVLSLSSSVGWDIAADSILSQWSCACLLPSLNLNEIFNYNLFYGWYAEKVLWKNENTWSECGLHTQLNYYFCFQIYSYFFNSLVFSWKRVKLSCMNTTTDVYVKILSNVKIKWILWYCCLGLSAHVCN